MLIHADFSQRVVVATDEMPWVASPLPGVERRMLDRIGDEVARATSIVRYAPGSYFSPHDHALGEEFLVLDGVFSDEQGDYPAGTYVRNPPGSQHRPHTREGCTIFVKLRQMPLTEIGRIVVDTKTALWTAATHGHSVIKLYTAADGERVTLERLAAGLGLPAETCATGEEIFVLSGDLMDEQGAYGPNTWIRNPPGHRRSLKSEGGSVYWVKRGHLRP